MLAASPATAADNTWVVNSTGDGGGACTRSSCTLRAAIVAANGSLGSDRITFAIEPRGRHTITVGAGQDRELPAVTGNDVVINATTQPGGGAHGIRLDDPDTSGGESGFVLAGRRITVRGFIITRFDRYGIYVMASSRNDVVAGNWIGTRDGVSDDGVGDDGIHVKGGGGHRIGGTGPVGRNVVAGGANDGIELEDSSENVIIGNYVAMTADGLTRLPNTGSGIEINGLSFRNRVGGTTARQRNIASGSDGIGIQILGTMQPDGTCQAPQRNLVQGNYVGLNVRGRKPGSYGNRGAGVEMGVCARHNTIGGTAAGARNVASGNRDDGIQLDGAGGPGGSSAVCENTIQGNYVGLGPGGQAARANVDDGIDLARGACNNLVGGTLATAANVVAGNLNDGIDLHEQNAAGAGTNGNVIRGNVVGLAADGKTAVRNLRHGVHIRFLSQRNVIRANVIAASGGSGVAIEHPSARSNIVRGNKIGTARDGVTVRGNALHGIWFYDGTRLNVVRNNLVTGSGRDGVTVEQIVGSATTTKQNRITRNRILRNGGLGIDLLPIEGVNGNDGTTSPQVGNVGLDFPVIARATSSSVVGNAPPNSIVEVFAARTGAGQTNGEGSRYVARALANRNGAWCLNRLSLRGSVTATASDDAGNTSEFGANVSVAGSKNLCIARDPGVTASAPCVGAQSTSYQRVVWIVMEDKDYSQVIGSPNAPYINDLARKCGVATQFYAQPGGSLANYIAMTSGSTQGIRDVRDPSAHPLSVPSIFSQLPAAWRALQESMPSNCYLTNNGLYVVRHNPAAYYTNIRAGCLRRDVPLRDPPDVSARFTFITPNLCNGMHYCSEAQDIPTQVRRGNAWLSVWLPKILNSAAYKSGSMAVFLTWGGGSGTLHVPTVVIAPSVRRGTRSSRVFNHYALLRTTEEMLGRTTFLGNARSAPSMRAAFGL